MSNLLAFNVNDFIKAIENILIKYVYHKFVATKTKKRNKTNKITTLEHEKQKMAQNL
jgi:hypothetical protein